MVLKVKRAGSDEYGRFLKLLLAGDPGSGKHQPLSAPMLTPAGWTTMGEVEVGTTLVGSDGNPITVTHVFDHGEQDMYRVTFDDGAELLCGGPHLWTVQTRKTHYVSENWTVLSTVEMMQRGVVKQRQGNRRPQMQFFVPVVQPVQFDKVDLPLDPYLLGTLLANGGLTGDSVSIVTNDEWVIDKIKARNPMLIVNEHRRFGCRRWGVHNLQPTLRRLGLMGLGSHDKFVPEVYLHAHEDARRELLAGLCDGDGSSGKDNRRPGYYTTSVFLRDAVVELVRSLGGLTRVRVDDRDGQAPCFEVYILGLNPFTLPRKVCKMQAVWRAITSIESAGREPARCIKVDAVDELYVTKDYIVTHNTRMSSTFPNVFYANVEGGLMSVADRAVPFADISSSDDLNGLLQALRQPPKAREAALGVPVSTIVIDTLDAFQKLLVDERKRNEKKETMAIADWGWLGDQLRMVVRNFRNLEMNVIFTCHVKTDSDAESGQTFVKPALQGAMGDEIAAYVDIAGLLKASPKNAIKDGKTIRVLQRTIQTGPDLRHPWLKDRSGKLPFEFDVNLVNDGISLIQVIYGQASAAPSEVVEARPAPEVKQAKLVEEPVAPVAKAPPVKATAAPKPEVAQPEIPKEAIPAHETPSQPEGQPEPEIAPQVVAALEEVFSTTPKVAEPKLTKSEGRRVATLVQETPRTNGSGHEVPDPSMICEECGKTIETMDQRDLGRIRFRRSLCRNHFLAAKEAKK